MMVSLIISFDSIKSSLLKLNVQILLLLIFPRYKQFEKVSMNFRLKTELKDTKQNVQFSTKPAILQTAVGRCAFLFGFYF